MTILVVFGAFVLLTVAATLFGADTRVSREWARRSPDDRSVALHS